MEDDPHRFPLITWAHKYMDLVFAHADRITVLNYGQVLFEGTPEEVRASALVQETYLGEPEAIGFEPC